MKRKLRRVLDTEDVTKLWKCHPETVRNQVRYGKLKPLSIQPFLFRRDDVLKLPVPKIGRPKKSVEELITV